MKTYIIFYSRKEIPDEQVGVLKNHLSDCLVFCNLDGTNIKESRFWYNDGNNKIIICGSQNTLKSWAKQWTQAYSTGYDYNAKGLIFYISQENLKDLSNGNVSMDNAQEDICIDGFINFGECKYLCGGVEFHSAKKAILNKIKHNVGSITRPSKTVVRQSHGSVIVMQKNGETQQYTIPTPDLSFTTKYFSDIGIGIRDEGDATIQVVPDYISPDNIRTEFSAMYPKGFIAFHINGTWLLGDVSEIVAASETANKKKKKRTPKKENATQQSENVDFTSFDTAKTAKTTVVSDIDDFSSFDSPKVDKPGEISDFDDFTSFDSLKTEKASEEINVDDFGSFSTEKKEQTENKKTERQKENEAKDNSEPSNKVPTNDRLDFNESAVLLLLEENGIITTGLLQNKFKVTYGEAAKMILALSEKGWVVHTENGWVKNK